MPKIKAFPQRQLGKVEKRHGCQRAYQNVHPHRQDEEHDQRFRVARTAPAQYPCGRVAEDDASQRGEDGYSDGVDKRVHRFGMGEEFGEISQCKVSGFVCKRIDNNQQQRNDDKDYGKNQVG